MTEIIVLRGSRHVVWECRTCGVVATCPEMVYEEHRREGGYQCCPNGHQWGWSKDTCEREQLRRERDRLKQQIAQKNDEIQSERRRAEHLDRSRAAYIGQVTKLRTRAKAGVRPCCNRTFQNLTRHMESKHPEFEAEAPKLDAAE